MHRQRTLRIVLTRTSFSQSQTQNKTDCYCPQRHACWQRSRGARDTVSSLKITDHCNSSQKPARRLRTWGTVDWFAGLARCARPRYLSFGKTERNAGVRGNNQESHINRPRMRGLTWMAGFHPPQSVGSPTDIPLRAPRQRCSARSAIIDQP